MSLYQIDLNKMCRSIESNNSLEAIEYIDEYVRSIEWKMNEADFESKKPEIKSALDKLYDSMEKTVDSAIQDSISKYLDKNVLSDKTEAEKAISECIKITQKQQFVNDIIDYISSGRHGDGIPFLTFEIEKLNNMTDKNIKIKKIVAGFGSFITSNYLVALLMNLTKIGGLPALAALIASTIVGNEIAKSYMLQGDKIKRNIKTESKSISEANNLKDYFSFKWEKDSKTTRVLKIKPKFKVVK